MLALLKPEVADEVMVDDFDVKDRIVLIRTETDPMTLSDAGFAQTHKLSRIN